MFEGGEEDIWVQEGRGHRRKLHIEELHHLYSLTNTNQVIKKNKIGWACGTYGAEMHRGFSGETLNKETTYEN
jgi:hypothetical protein